MIESVNESVLVNALGHSAGVLIFGIFLYLLIQDRAARHLAGSTKSMVAAALALLWNLASLVMLGSNSEAMFVKITACSGFSVLSLLPAVLFDLCLRERFRLLVRLGYGLSAVTIFLHITELFHGGSNNHRLGLALIPIGYGTLTIIAAAGVLASRDQNRRVMTSRLIGTMSLFLLAMSFVHLRSAHVTQIWSRELAFHHAAIPLALLVLLQDYRFVLLDAFLRFLANVLLAALFIFGAIEAWRLIWFPGPQSPFGEVAAARRSVFLLVVYALLRSSVQNVLTRMVFRQPDRDALLESLTTPVRDERAYLQSATQALGDFMGAAASVVDDPRLLDLDLRRPLLVSELPQLSHALRSELEEKGVEAIVPVRIGFGATRRSRPDRACIACRSAGKPRLSCAAGPPIRGRRFLSEDLQALGRAAGADRGTSRTVPRIGDAPSGGAGRAARLAIPDSPALSVQRAEHAVRHHSARSQGRARHGVSISPTSSATSSKPRNPFCRSRRNCTSSRPILKWSGCG